MKAIARTVMNPHRYISKHFYSSDKKAGKMNLELVDIPTEEEIENEVSDGDGFSSAKSDYDAMSL